MSPGLVEGIELRDGHVGVAIEVEPQRGKMEPLRKPRRRAVEALDGVLSATAVLDRQATPVLAAARAPPTAGRSHGRAGHGHGAAAASRCCPG